MKKFIGFLLVFVVALTAVSCKGKKDEYYSDEESGTEESVQAGDNYVDFGDLGGGNGGDGDGGETPSTDDKWTNIY